MSVVRPGPAGGPVPRIRRGPPLDRGALVAFAVLLLVALLGPLLVDTSPVRAAGAPFVAPGHGFLLGTDELGQDIAVRLLHGTRQSLLGAAAVITSGVLLGGLVGLVAGACGGLVDGLLMRLTDAFLALPGPVLALAVAAALGRSYAITLVAVAVVWWPLYARIVRGEVRALRGRPFADAARLAGVRPTRLWVRHLLPGVVAPVVVTASLDVGGLVLTVAGLSFLGLGAPQPAPELGAMAAQGLPYLLSAPWVPFVPAAAVFVTGLVTTLAGDAVRDRLTPR